MNFSTQQLPSGKWGIYSDSRLLATVSCQKTCQTIFSNLLTGRRDAPCNDANALYQLPGLRHPSSKQNADLNAAAETSQRFTASKSPSKSKAKKRKVSLRSGQLKPSSYERLSKVSGHMSASTAS